MKNKTLVLLLFSFLLASVFVGIMTNLQWESFTAGSRYIIDGVAKLPFQHRILSPEIIARFQFAGLSEYQANILFYFLGFAGLIFIYVRFLLAQKLSFMLSVSSALVLCISVFGAWNTRHCPTPFAYDITNLIFVVGLVWAAQKRMQWWFLLFAIAVLNRETVIMWVPIMMWIRFKKDGISHAIMYGTLSLLIFTMIKWALILRWPGTPFVPMFYTNIQTLLDVANAPYLSLLLAFCGMWAFAIFGFKHLPVGMKPMVLSLLGLIPLAIVGTVYEVRVYLEFGLWVIPAGLIGLEKVLSNECQHS